MPAITTSPLLDFQKNRRKFSFLSSSAGFDQLGNAAHFFRARLLFAPLGHGGADPFAPVGIGDGSGDVEPGRIAKNVRDHDDGQPGIALEKPG